jgi:hypothetical protein
MQKGEQLPHFTTTDVNGRRFEYASVWQHKHLLLVTVSDEPASQAYVSAVMRQTKTIMARDAVCVITRDAIPGVPRPGVVIADRWGEIQYIGSAGSVAGLPAPDELVEWLEYVQQQCPECQGETR